ncbi:MAG: adenylate/guanylate cyclase domain-containing protein [Deltaproteobacteria bacterium]|nr:adenylate/guanylate cyclase domain-containing protein [Deltaproteobacteria bacterium]
MKTLLKSLRVINPFFLTCTTIAIVITLFLYRNTFIDFVESKTYDLRLISRGRVEPSQSIVLAVIDEKSLEMEGRWPWPRSKIAELVDILSRDGAKVISFDVGFLEPDENTQLGFIDKFGHQLDALDIRSSSLTTFIAESKKNANNDLVLATAIRNSTAKVVLGYFFHMNRTDLDYQLEAEKIEQQIARISASKYPLVLHEGDEKEDRFIHAYSPVGNLDILAASTDAAGYYSVRSDPDGVVRWMPLVIQCGEDIYPPLSVVSAYHYLDMPRLMVEVDEQGVEGIRMGQLFIPTDETGQLLINYLGPAKTFPHISISDILGGGVPKGIFKDKIVIVGGTATGTHDTRSTPFTPLYPGVEIHATVVDNILTENFMVKPRWTLIYDLTAIIILAVLAGIALPRMGPLKGLLFVAVLFNLYIFFAYWFLLYFKLWLNIAYPLLALLFNYTVLRVHGYITKDRERKKIQGTFKQYVAPLVIEEMIKEPSKLKLGGEEKELTIMFNDIAGFTSLSERHSPTEMVSMLGSYFEKMTEEIFNNRGTLETYRGDGFMAIFGAPIEREDHAEKACDAALAMQNRLVELRAGWAKTGHPLLTARTGINTGPMLVGNLGCKYRFVYGALGDNVNLASRLEGLSKEYNTEILIGNNTASRIRNSFLLREIDLVRVKGREVPVRIYELLARANSPLGAGREEADGLYSSGLEAYRHQAWREALTCFNRALSVRADDGAAKTMAARCKVYLGTPYKDNWDGVFEQINW